jgi:hypothetical protein
VHYDQFGWLAIRTRQLGWLDHPNWANRVAGARRSCDMNVRVMNES